MHGKQSACSFKRVYYKSTSEQTLGELLDEWGPTWRPLEEAKRVLSLAYRTLTQQNSLELKNIDNNKYTSAQINEIINYSYEPVGDHEKISQ